MDGDATRAKSVEVKEFAAIIDRDTNARIVGVAVFVSTIAFAHNAKYAVVAPFVSINVFVLFAKIVGEGRSVSTKKSGRNVRIVVVQSMSGRHLQQQQLLVVLVQ